MLHDGAPARWAGIGAATAAALGGIVGLVVGLVAFPLTAWFAALEVGAPAALVGGLLGLVGGTIAMGVSASTGPRADRRGARPRHATSRWPDAVVVLGAGVVLSAWSSMEWASRVDDLGKVTPRDGPSGLLVVGALASSAIALVVLATRWRWPRWILLATALTTAVSAVVVALARIAAANGTGQGATRTAYGPGALVGVGTSFVVAACAVVGFLEAFRHHPDRADGGDV